MKTIVTLALAGLATGAIAATPVGEDQVAASFTRMFAHAPAPTAPADRTALAHLGSDPLVRTVSAALWAQEPAGYHVPQVAAFSARPTPARAPGSAR
ncbi:MAG: hypothetical protein J0H00_20375 [Burkholderiales bacterium]|nr:hypothetical protein [Burkholderiales bacterium]OJX06728.1 MAG: hypothetical protein BGO72_00030 [Burkholderiales bacterium 70-64]